MLLVADKGREDEVFAVFRKWGLEAVEIGIVTGDGKLRVRHHGEMVAEIPNRELADEAPLYDRPHTTPLRRVPLDAPSMPHGADVQDALPDAAGAARTSVPSAGSGSSTITRCAPTRWPVPSDDAAIIRIKETGTSVAMSLDGNGRYCYLSPREGAMLAVAEAAATSRRWARGRWPRPIA